MSYANGRLPQSALTKIQTDAYLAKPTAVAWNALKAAAKKELGRTIAAAGPAGAYRPEAWQDAMHKAGAFGPASARIRWGLNPNSTVSIAVKGYSSHGFGTRIDIVGTPMDAKFLALAKRFGFTREFGAADPNHFMHDGRTAIKATVVKKVAAKVASKQVFYVVKSGDTLSGIAGHYSTDKARLTLAKLLTLNPSIKNANSIKVGQRIRVA